MNDVVSALLTAFNRFVLRDVLGKMVPGGIFLLGLVVAIGVGIRKTNSSESTRASGNAGLACLDVIASADKVILDVPTSVAVLLILSTWIAGFVVQEIGSWPKLLKTEATRFPACTRTQRARVEKAVRRALAQCEYEQRQAALVERHVVIKEASGNTGVAILLSAIALVVGTYSPLHWTLPVLLVPIFLALILRHHRNRIIQRLMDDLVVRPTKSEKEEKAP